MGTRDKVENGGGAISGLLHAVLSWSFHDVFNNNLYKDKVMKIPNTFESTAHYMDSFIFPLLEETRTALLSDMEKVAHAPICLISAGRTTFYQKPTKSFFYKITRYDILDHMGRVVGDYEPVTGDLIAITNVKPRRIEDINRPDFGYFVAYVQSANPGSILTFKPIPEAKDLYAVYIGNLTTNMRIWKALHPDLNGPKHKIIQSVLQMNRFVMSQLYCSSDI